MFECPLFDAVFDARLEVEQAFEDFTVVRVLVDDALVLLDQPHTFSRGVGDFVRIHALLSAKENLTKGGNIALNSRQ